MIFAVNVFDAAVTQIGYKLRLTIAVLLKWFEQDRLELLLLPGYININLI